MVAIADRSPARCNFDLNWRKVPSGPLAVCGRRSPVGRPQHNPMAFAVSMLQFEYFAELN